MKSRFTIANKLILGFGVLILASITNGLYTYSTLNNNQSLNQQIVSVYDPSITKLEELLGLVSNTQMLVKNWVYIEKQSGTKDKQRLSDIHAFTFPELRSELLSISESWEDSYKEQINSIIVSISDTLFNDHLLIMEALNSPLSYENEAIFNDLEKLAINNGTIDQKTQEIMGWIDSLEQVMENHSTKTKVEMNASFAWFQKYIIYAMLILSVFIVFAGFFTSRGIVNSIYQLSSFLITMTKGILPKDKLITSNDEIGDMGNALNGYVDNLRKTSDFAVAIGAGEFDSDYKSLGDDDTLGNALLDMRENLKLTGKEITARAERDKIRNWATKGLADFGDILRQNSENMDKLAKNIMTNVIDYLEVNQGAIYIVNEKDESEAFLEMKSSIAYDREKFKKKHFKLREGLVGRCAFEKLPVYLKELPEDYITIKSGLGTAEPSNLLLVPIVINDIVMGVIEVASFNVIPEHMINFLTTLGENIASTILNVRTNEQTQHLLDESKVRSDELSAQEEELRQNMEELQATQEEATRREKEMSYSLDAINNTIGSIEIDKSGVILSVNDYLLGKLKAPASALIGINFNDLFSTNNANEFTQAWTGVTLGESESIITNYLTQEGEFWFQHTFTPFKNESGEFTKAVDLIVDITNEKILEREIEALKLNAH